MNPGRTAKALRTPAASRDAGIESVKKNGPSKEVKDLTKA